MDDPFAGLVQAMDRRAARAARSPVCVGTVLEAAPGRLVIRCDGLELDQDDLLVASHLTAGWTQTLTGLGWPLTAQLPKAKFSGTCRVTVGTSSYTGTAEVTRPEEQVAGITADQGSATYPTPLAAGDWALLLRSEDGQSYYVLCKFVRW